MSNYWTIGYAPFSKVPGAGIYPTRAAAEIAARNLNRLPGEYRGRGLKAVKCDAAGRLVR